MIPRSLVIVLLALFAAPAIAGGPPSPYRLIPAEEARQLRPDRAYLLMRLGKPYPGGTTAVFMKVPSTSELAYYEAAKREAFAKAGKKAGPYESFLFTYRGVPNLFAASPKTSIVDDERQTAVLAEVLPGDYVFYGYGYGKFVAACWCLGSVQFAAPAGKVIDLGTIFMERADKPSAVPELQSETNLGATAAMDYRFWSAALRPVGAGDAVPPPVPSALIQAAQFKAVGPWIDPNVQFINRLAAVAGVLRYDQGRVIDVASGQEMPPH